nr:MAG TPA: hypothetical protein [Caudoviricetes sp.]
MRSMRQLVWKLTHPLNVSVLTKWMDYKHPILSLIGRRTHEKESVSGKSVAVRYRACVVGFKLWV